MNAAYGLSPSIAATVPHGELRPREEPGEHHYLGGVGQARRTKHMSASLEQSLTSSPAVRYAGRAVGDSQGNKQGLDRLRLVVVHRSQPATSAAADAGLTATVVAVALGSYRLGRTAARLAGYRDGLADGDQTDQHGIGWVREMRVTELTRAPLTKTTTNGASVRYDERDDAIVLTINGSQFTEADGSHPGLLVRFNANPRSAD